MDRVPLPAVLNEVSGLALDAAGVLLSIADEEGLIYRIAPATGEVHLHAEIGNPPVKADFEGLAVKDGALFALTSKGHIYQLGPDRGDYRRHKTGLADECEFEGLAADPQAPQLWLLCKIVYRKKHRDKLVIYKWNVVEEALVDEERLRVEFRDLGFKRRLAPSGLAFDVDGEHVVVIAAKEQAYVRLTRDGRRTHHGHLPALDAHPQAEGIAVTADGVFIADERGRAPASLTRYTPRFWMVQ